MILRKGRTVFRSMFTEDSKWCKTPYIRVFLCMTHLKRSTVPSFPMECSGTGSLKSNFKTSRGSDNDLQGYSHSGCGSASLDSLKSKEFYQRKEVKSKPCRKLSGVFRKGFWPLLLRKHWSAELYTKILLHRVDVLTLTPHQQRQTKLKIKVIHKMDRSFPSSHWQLWSHFSCMTSLCYYTQYQLDQSPSHLDC